MEQVNEIEPGGQTVKPFEPPQEAKPAAELSEIDTLRLEVDDLTRSLRLAEARNEVTSMLSLAGARSPELLFEAAGKLLQFADDGSLLNAEAVSNELRRKFPEQFAVTIRPMIDAGAGSTTSPQALTREALARMKPAEIARLNWDDVRHVLSN